VRSPPLTCITDLTSSRAVPKIDVKKAVHKKRAK
jgi:hypothetical protein